MAIAKPIISIKIKRVKTWIRTKNQRRHKTLFSQLNYFYLFYQPSSPSLQVPQLRTPLAVHIRVSPSMLILKYNGGGVLREREKLGGGGVYKEYNNQ
jgi:hypothetical protein